jgi:tripartite-type tricarboxylate transporter receptor subunit TctC
MEAEGDSLFGVYGPTGVPREIVMRLNREIGRIMQMPQARAALASFAAEVATASPEEFGKPQNIDRERYGRFIREAAIRLE